MSSFSFTLTLLVTFSVLLVLTSAAPQFFPQRVYPDEPPTPYEYQYRVENPPTSTYFGKSEAGDAAGRVTGSYFVYLPDGRLMTIDYSVNGDSGFVPRVTFSNQPIGIQG